MRLTRPSCVNLLAERRDDVQESPLPCISRADLARLAQVSPAAVTQAVKARRLASEADGSINTDLPLNKAWLDRRRAKPASPATGHGVPTKPAKSAPPAAEEEAEDDLLQTTLESNAEKLKLTKARRELAEESAARVRLEIATKKGQLIPLDLERRKWSAFDAALKSNLRDLARRSAARLHAIAVAEGPAALERALEAEVSSALSRTLEAAKSTGLG